MLEAWPRFVRPPPSKAASFVVGTRVAPKARATATFSAWDQDVGIHVEVLEVESQDVAVDPVCILEQVVVGSSVLLLHPILVYRRGESFLERWHRWDAAVRAEMRRLDMLSMICVMWDMARGRSPMTQTQIDQELRAQAEQKVGPEPKEEEGMVRTFVLLRKGETMTFQLYNPTATLLAFAAHLLVESA